MAVVCEWIANCAKHLFVRCWPIADGSYQGLAGGAKITIRP
jgi:hypothetical protein